MLRQPLSGVNSAKPSNASPGAPTDPEAARKVRAWWFAQLLGLDRLAPRAQVSAVTAEPERIRVGLDTAEGRLVLHLEPRSEREAFLKTRHLAVSYQGATPPVAVQRTLQQVAAARLERYTFERLRGLAARGEPAERSPARPGAAPAASTLPVSQEPPQRPAVPAPPVYVDFFGYDAFESLGRPTGSLPRLFQLVLHCDNECSQHGPDSFGGAAAALETPYREVVKRTADLSPPPQVSGLTERDVILGNPTGLRHAVHSASALVEVEQRPLLLCNTCVPAVTGEDVEGIANDATERPGSRVNIMGPGPDAVFKLLRRVLTRRFGPGSAEGPAGPPARVSLVGVPDDEAAAELRGWLGQLGLEVVTVVVPDLEWSRLDALRGAGTHVYVEHRWWRPLYEVLQALVPGRHVVLPGPYGWERTAAWLRAVAREAGASIDPEEVVARALAVRAEAREAATRAAGGRAVGFVIDERTAACLADPATAWGVPLVDACCEAGFDVEVWRHRAVPPEALASLEERLERAAFPGRLRVHAFETEAALGPALVASGVRAVFSQYRLDRRLTTAGKNRIAFAAFEMGFDGALRTADRLRALCDRAFFPAFGRYLRPAAADDPASSRRAAPEEVP